MQKPQLRKTHTHTHAFMFLFQAQCHVCFNGDDQRTEKEEMTRRSKTEGKETRGLEREKWKPRKWTLKGSGIENRYDDQEGGINGGTIANT